MELNYTRSDGVHGKGCRLEELNSDHMDVTELSICNLERGVVLQVEGGSHSLLMNKIHLKHLKLHWEQQLSDAVTNAEEVLAELSPPPCLERLEIDGYAGRRFPSWMMSLSLGTFLPQLRSLVLMNCLNALELPPLGLLPELRVLKIENAPGVVDIGPEFFGDGVITSVSFPKLETLQLSKMENLQEWACGAEDDGRLSRLPHLQELNVSYCPALESLPRCLKQCPLKVVRINSVGVRVVDNLTCLTDEMYISCCSRLERISDLQALKELHISDCSDLKMISDLQALRYLIFQDDENEYLPEWLLRFLQLRQEQQRDNEEDDFQLVLHCAAINLQKRCHMGCQYWPIIQHVPRVTVFDFEEQRNCLEYTKRPFLYRSIFSYVDLG